MTGPTGRVIRDNTGQRGSGLVLAIFVLFLVTSLGVALLFLSRNEVELSQADVRSKTTFFLAEAGLEDGRTTLWELNRVSADEESLDEELLTVAGVDGRIDFDVNNLVPQFDDEGNLTGLTGYNDDVPIRGLSNLADGRYIAFMTNDPAESLGISQITDTNDLVMITGVGGGGDGSLEIVQAIVRRKSLFPEMPATITILGPSAGFNGGKSTPKRYTGDDTGPHCPGGDPSVHKPVVGVIGSASEGAAESGVYKPASYTTDILTGTDTVVDLTTDPALDTMWTDCDALVDMAAEIKAIADHVVADCSDLTTLGTPGDEKVTFVDGDCALSGGFAGQGLLLVTGMLTFDGNAQWNGPLFVVGQGDFERPGAGMGDIAGAIVVADVEGPDATLFTSDDCSGDDGIVGTADDGIASSTYVVSGAGTSTTGYCSAYLRNWMAARPLQITSFRQR